MEPDPQEPDPGDDPATPRPYWREAIALLPDLGRLLRSLSRDPRVPWHAKAIAAAAALYVASPIDLLPDVVPGVGGVDDLVAVLVAVRRLVTAAGYEVVREHWTGSDDGFGVLIVLAGVGTARPRASPAQDGETDVALDVTPNITPRDAPPAPNAASDEDRGG